jgi:hypothetical protein
MINKNKKVMNKALDRMKGIDWIVSETKPDEEKIEKWTTELIKSLEVVVS